ncbi:hypothetical protein ACFY9F_32645 [Streptomyces sp. NPDC012421]|uniref:hypothetical protein n=1 Tax=Streptomyces sp. NPDC012421 TaxID=3364832 RepID=UPI0036ECF564
MLLVKVDGPALGRNTLSLDPAEATDAGARRATDPRHLLARPADAPALTPRQN